MSNFCSCLFQEKALDFGDTPMPLLRDCVENLVTGGIKENHFHAPIMYRKLFRAAGPSRLASGLDG